MHRFARDTTCFCIPVSTAGVGLLDKILRTRYHSSRECESVPAAEFGGRFWAGCRLYIFNRETVANSRCLAVRDWAAALRDYEQHILADRFGHTIIKTSSVHRHGIGTFLSDLTSDVIRGHLPST